MDKSSDQLTIKTESLPQNGAPRTFTVDLERFQEHLAELAQGVGGNAELGRRLGVSGQFIDMLITGKRKPGPKILKAIGGRRKIMIEIDV